MIEILVVDDHPIVREGLTRLIEFEKDMTVVGTAKNSSEAINMASTKKMDVIVLDISMPGRSGLDIIQDLKKILPAVKIIILSMYEEERFALRAFKAGASGYVTKEMATEEIADAIRKVYAGGKYISARFAEKMVDGLTSPGALSPHEQLSDRELQVMCLIASGKTISEIAHELSLSDRTISTYRARILEKMNMKNNAEITHYAIENGLWR